MKKTFREQLAPVIEERYRNDSAATKKRHLDEATTHTAETLITYIRQWPDQHGSRNQALGGLLERRRWNDKGQLVLESNFKGKSYPLRLPLALAFEAYQYGDQRKQYWPSYSFPDCLKHIPANATEDALEEIKSMFHDIQRMSVKEAQIISLGYYAKILGAGNPHAITHSARQVKEFADAQKAIEAFVKDREGWDHLTVENIQDPKHKVGMSQVISDILAKADELVEPAYAAIAEQDRRMYARQDATHARNSVKTLKKHFSKYAVDAAELDGVLLPISQLIDSTETKALENKPTVAA